jgi:hypothetical protein
MPARGKFAQSVRLPQPHHRRCARDSIPKRPVARKEKLLYSLRTDLGQLPKGVWPRHARHTHGERKCPASRSRQGSQALSGLELARSALLRRSSHSRVCAGWVQPGARLSVRSPSHLYECDIHHSKPVDVANRCSRARIDPRAISSPQLMRSAATPRITNRPCDTTTSGGNRRPNANRYGAKQ